MSRTAITLAALSVLFATGISSKAVDSADDYKLSVGNPQRCETRRQFPVLPGGGWDNLRNKEMGIVVIYNYSRCATTDDGRYLVPDGIYTIPIKNSKLETSAELIKHWDEFTSSLSSSINIDAKVTKPSFQISGKFSFEYESIKTYQQNQQSYTTRIQARYLRYRTRLSKSTLLSADFKARVKKIGLYVTLNKTDLARYESQLLVRDYGTHVITSMDVGAALSKISQVDKHYVKTTASDTRTVTASASADFFQQYHIGGDVSVSTSTSTMQAYRNAVTQASLQTFGGHMYSPGNFSTARWIQSVDDDMVALDVNGDPLFFFINDETLPELPTRTVYQIQDHVSDAITAYYMHNTYMGCTDPGSKNFYFQANLDDGTCKPPNNNFTLGGVFQRCTWAGHSNMCPPLTQRNPLTGGFSCPGGYREVLINTGSKAASQTVSHCSRCYLFFRCCKAVVLRSSASYSAYWCAAEGQVGMNQGLLFGGTFTTRVRNPITNSNSCPLYFYGVRILQDLTVCLSDDYELSFRYSLSFGGLFSCKSGNPLVMSEDRAESTLLKSGQTMMNFLQSSGVSTYPRACPKGYSQHLVVVDSGCQINFCAKVGSLTDKSLPTIQRPPFIDAPFYDMVDLDDTDVVVKGDGQEWTAPSVLQPARQTSQQTGNQDTTSGTNGMSVGAAATLGVLATLVVVGIVVAVVVLIRRRQNYKGLGNNEQQMQTRSP